jgi:hypothetical protein
MKKIIILSILPLLNTGVFAQVNISTGAQWVNSGSVSIVLENMNLENNGTFAASGSTVKFTGNSSHHIAGSSVTSFYDLEIAKSGNNTLAFFSNANVNNRVVFTSGFIDLNQRNLNLATNAYLQNENENSRIIGPNGGEVIIIRNMNKPSAINAGNLGAMITSNSNLGTVTIKRGHLIQSGAGLETSINRYYNITNSGNNINATLRFHYFDAELNGQEESLLALFQSTNSGANWNNQSFTTRNAAANYVEKTGLSALALTTLAAIVPPPPPPPPPVTGLVFNAGRTNNTTVQLTWSTQTETNMSGYEVQRRLSTETDFTARTFVNSSAPGGNSNTPLSYYYTDANSHTGTSYYRLKIVDLNNNFIYSEIKTVAKAKGGGNGGGGNGNGNGGGGNKSAGNEFEVESTPQAAKITVGPNPNNGNFWFIVSGIEKETSASLYTTDGKLLKSFKVVNQQQQQVNGLPNGVYMLKVPGLDAFKVVVQGSSGTTTNFQSSSSPMIKN